MGVGTRSNLRLVILMRCDKMSKTWVYIKNAVLAIGLLYFMYGAGVAADAGNTADVIYCLFFIWFIARK